MKLDIFEKGIKKVEANHRNTFEVGIKYDIFSEMQGITEKEWEGICKEVNRKKFLPKIEDFITAKKEIAKPVYHDDGKNYPVRCIKCDHMVAVRYASGIAKNYVCGHCKEDERVPF